VRIGAFLAALHKRSHDVIVSVHLEKTVFGHGVLAFLPHKTGKHRIRGLDLIDFLLLNRSPAVPNNAARTFAFGIITAEILSQHVL